MYRQNLICFFFKTEIESYYACMTGEPGGLLSLGLHRVGHDWSDLAAAAACMYYPEIDFCHLLMYQRHSLGICVYYILFIYFFSTYILCSVAPIMSDTNSLWPHGLQATRLLCPWNFPGDNTGLVCHVLLQGVFLTQGSKPHLLHLLHCRWILYHWATWEALFSVHFYIYFLQASLVIQLVKNPPAMQETLSLIPG